MSGDEYTTVLLQGAGTFSVESVIQTGIPRTGGKLVVLSNGAYGDRIAAMAKYLDVETITLRFDELQPLDLDELKSVCIRLTMRVCWTLIQTGVSWLLIYSCVIYKI